jgi:hypothetical protein
VAKIRGQNRATLRFLQFDWLIFLVNYYHEGFRKGREAGRSSGVVKVDFDFSLVKSEVQVALKF